MAQPTPAETFLAALAHGTAPDATAALRRALVAYGSETPDNRACAEALGFGASGDLSLAQAGGIAVTDLAWSLEEIALPPQIAAAVPALTPQSWAAFTRLVTLVLMAVSDERPNGPA